MNPRNSWEQIQAVLRGRPRRWLVTGAAGFIGSHLVETLLKLGQRVAGLDNLSTGRRDNLAQVRALVGERRWRRFQFIQGDITNLATCRTACRGMDFVLHQAALGSVPLSIAEPLATHAANVTGFLNILLAAHARKVKRVVYASSSAVYGDNPDLPKLEHKTGRPLSPYAASKAMDELYAGAFAEAYQIGSIGLRYFNVFGPRQDPAGAYAAVIPKWIDALLKKSPCRINGDGETSRDFCFVDNVVQANLLAATTENPAAVNQVFNVATGGRTTLNELFFLLQDGLRRRDPGLPPQKPVYQAFRAGDIRHSLADISRAQSLLGFAPVHGVREGLEQALDWYVANVAPSRATRKKLLKKGTPARRARAAG